jgi:alpha-beta hydrolase superfamily lysophospholipase
MKECKVTDHYGHNLHVYVFDDVEDVIGVFQLVHGVNEHGLRYKEFAEFLNEQGYVVYIHDHVSQGKSRIPLDKDVVNFGKHGDKVLVDGVNVVRKQIRDDYPESDIFAFGHSLGALILRKYLMDYDNEYKKIILNGTGYADTKGIGLVICIGRFLKIFGNGPSSFFDNIFRQTQLKLNEKVKINHFIEWLTRDEEYTKKNLSDKFLYIRLTKGSFISLLRLVKNVNNLNLINKRYGNKLDILLLSGTHDPSTDFGVGTNKLNTIFNELRLNSSCILYDEGRHDTIQETNRGQVYTDVINYVKN